MLDGVPLTFCYGCVRFKRLTTDAVSRIEVVRGSAAHSTDRRRLAAVINMFTREGSGAPKFTCCHWR